MTNLERVHYYFQDLESPEKFISWDFLYMISSCLGRRVWLQANDFPIFPNLYLIIVGPPAVGKSLPAVKMANFVRSLTEVLKDGKLRPVVNIVPDCITLEALYENIEAATKAEKKPNSAEFYFHASVSFLLGDELGILFKNKDTTADIIMFLIKGYECGDFQYLTKRNGKNEIKNMCVNFFGCCTPAWMQKNLSGSMIDEGFSSRAIFLYGDQTRKITTFIDIGDEQRKAMEHVKEHFRAVSKLNLACTFSDEAFKLLDEWNHNKIALRINSNKKLDYYYGRKKIHLCKIAMLCHFAEKLTPVIDAEDMRMAMRLLADAEVDMHKALNVETRNPLHLIAENIKSLLGKAKMPLTRKQIIADIYSGGDIDEIDKALTYLHITEQIIIEGPNYRLGGGKI